MNLYKDNKGNDEGFVFLVGNKVDLDYREVTGEMGLQKAKELGIPYLEVSAKSGKHLERLFINVI